jgi:hypothetical protein
VLHRRDLAMYIAHLLGPLYGALNKGARNEQDLQVGDKDKSYRILRKPWLEIPKRSMKALHYTCVYIYIYIYTGCFKNSFTSLKAYINVFRGHVKRFKLS